MQCILEHNLVLFIMFFFYNSQLILSKNPTSRGPYKGYAPCAAQAAFRDVESGKLSARKAELLYGVPRGTIRDRLKGRVNPEGSKDHRNRLFSAEEERELVEHLVTMCAFGYGYTRMEVISLASELACHLGKRTEDQPLTHYWLRSFMERDRKSVV